MHCAIPILTMHGQSENLFCMFIALGGCYNVVMWICMGNNHVNLFMLAVFHTKTQSPWGQQST